jgi:uncharacterized repeat protein (TIGR03803 family)
MTSDGGSNNAGTIFQIGTDGSDFGILHSFGGSGNGAFPYGSLTLFGSTLYGMTSSGGSSGLGTIFQIGTDGSGFGILHSFLGGSGDGRAPFGSLTLNGSTLYGTTAWGGPYGGSPGYGMVFSLTIPEPSTFALLGMAILVLAAYFTWRQQRTRTTSILNGQQGIRLAIKHKPSAAAGVGLCRVPGR